MRSRNCEARNGKIESNTLVKNQMWQSRFHKGQENVGNGRLAGSVRKETKFSFRHDGDKRAKSTSPPAPRPEPSKPQDVTKSSENHMSWRSKSIWESLSCKKVAFPRVLVHKTKEECKFMEKCPYAHRRVEEQPSKRLRKNGNKSAVGLHWRRHGNSVVYFKTWSRRDLHRFYGRAQPCRNQSDVFDSPKPYCAKPTVETKNHRLI